MRFKIPKRALRLAAHFLAIIGCTVIMASSTSAETTLEYLRSGLPRNVGGYSARSDGSLYDRNTIFSYIDGAGEVYNAYNMRACLALGFTKPGASEITLDIFDMGSPDDAFGVFTHDRGGTPVDIGHGGVSRPEWLSFWKGRFFVSLYSQDSSSEAAREVITALANQVAGLISAPPHVPKIVALLPRQGLDQDSIRFFHTDSILNFHYFLSTENILRLTTQTNATLAAYREGGREGMLLLIEYPKSGLAAQAEESFRKAYLRDTGESSITRIEDGTWAAVARDGAILTIVLNAGGQSYAEALLAMVQNKLSRK